MRIKASILGLLLLLWGCAAERRSDGPVGAPVPLLPDRELTPSTGAPATLRASAVIELKALPFGLRAFVAARTPRDFRIEVLSPFGTTEALFVSDGTTFYAYANGESRRHQWSAPDFPYTFRASEIVSFLLGAEAPEGGDYIVTKDEEGRTVRVIKLREDFAVLIAEMSDYRHVNGYAMPFSITIADGIEDFTLNYSSVDVGAPLEDEIFDTNGLP